ncbi:hypothetical protein [Pseudomonas marginalis]|uniref:Uncharacterized protein n=2 Tax=Pseudomonas marginalis TaxID=298 RepID=A0A3M3WIZ2_PSEMA|nr:hypothetical protein [Pseudomonas marginalis]KJZ51031.1 hypothetical protein VC37_25390 [Pseudomonas marginalis]KJZ60162.1 hypothetical protein VC36_09455 [Pseudomonas marginalis]OAJ47193.1 hypothetical protein AO064_28435 [Pseudomonas marginalis]RMO57690.1 hypothetical protein ALQ38_02620 [Pseudomonas marginalis pv. marginalis]RMP13681.1 hypothetical protein ALQ29_00242 [Pseudomonas marginalis pv. marginalis]
MKTTSSQRILLIVGLSALLTGPALAAFGDNPEPAANALSGDSAAGSALPPGTYPSSPSDSAKKTKAPDKQPAKTAKPVDRQKAPQEKPRSGS